MILYLNVEPHHAEPTWNKADYLVAAARRLGLEDKVKMYNNEPNPRFVLNIEPYVRFIKGTEWTGSWCIDLLINHTPIQDWHQCDDIFMAISTTFHNPGDNAHLLFQAADPVIHRKRRPSEADFVICGTTDLDIYEKRRYCYEVLKKEGFSFLSAGKGHAPATYTDHISKARVQFIRSMEVDGQGEIAQRFFECLAIGPVLTNYVSDLEHTGLIESLDYFSYKSDEEMVEKMHILVNDPGVRERMAYRGRQKALMYHSYEQRLAAIFAIIDERFSIVKK